METPLVIGQIRPFPYTKESDITDLPFVADVGKGKKKRRSFWQVRPNGDYTDECLMGEAYAIEALQYIMVTELSPLIGWAVMEMPREKDRSGIEIGFLGKIVAFAAYGAHVQAERMQNG